MQPPPQAPDSNPSSVRHTLLLYTVTLTAIAYLDRVCISAAKPQIQSALALSDSQMGYIFSAFTLAYALFEVPSGWLADRFGPRLMLTRIVLGWSLMTALTGAAWSFTSLCIIRLLFGLGEAGMFPGLTQAFTRWIPKARHGSVFGIALTAALLTGAATQKLVASLLLFISWRWTFPLFGSVGIIWALAWFYWFRDDPKDHPHVNSAELRLIHAAPLPPPSSRIPWRTLLTSTNLLALCGLYFGIIYGWYFYLTWMPDYLQRAHAFSQSKAGTYAALPLLAMAVAVFWGGRLSDFFCNLWGRRIGLRACAWISLPLAILTACLASHASTGEAAALLLAATAGLASLSVASAWTTTIDLGKTQAGLVSGFMNMFGNLGGALSPIVVGHCVQHWSATNPWLAWHLPILSTAIGYLLALTCWTLLDPSKPLTSPPELSPDPSSP